MFTETKYFTQILHKSFITLKLHSKLNNNNTIKLPLFFKYHGFKPHKNGNALCSLSYSVNSFMLYKKSDKSKINKSI